jgi:subtilisin family serine protease
MRRSLIMMASAAGLAATTLVGAAPAQATTNDPLYGKLWGLQQIHAEQAWATTTGAGAVVAVVDTGIDFTQPDLQDSGHGVIVCATSGPGFDLVAQGEVGAGVAGLGSGEVLAQLRDSGGGPLGR